MEDVKKALTPIEPTKMPQSNLPIKAPEPTPALPSALQADPYHGISSKPFATNVAATLMAPLDENDVEILPTTGALYLPEIKYRKRLNQAFGPGGWAMAPRSEFIMRDNVMSRSYALLVDGRFVSEARGEQEYIPNNPNTSEATATEGVKSNAIMRCCKDLGIASELWDPVYTSAWRAKHAVEVWTKNVNDSKSKRMWRRKDRPAFEYPWKEQGPVDANPNPPIKAPESKSGQQAPPPPPPANNQQGGQQVINEAQRKLVFARMKQAGIEEGVLRDYLMGRFNIESSKDIPAASLDVVLDWIRMNPGQQS